MGPSELCMYPRIQSASRVKHKYFHRLGADKTLTLVLVWDFAAAWPGAEAPPQPPRHPESLLPFSGWIACSFGIFPSTDHTQTSRTTASVDHIASLQSILALAPLKG